MRAGGLTDEQLTTLTETLQSTLEGVYLPSQLHALLQQSRTDPVGRMPIEGPRGTAEGAAAGASSAPAAAGSGAVVAGRAAGTGTRVETGAEAPPPPPRAPRGISAGAAPSQGVPLGHSGPDGVRRRSARASRTAVPYRYTPLAVAALGELLRRTDMHLASSLQPQVRPLILALGAMSARLTD